MFALWDINSLHENLIAGMTLLKNFDAPIQTGLDPLKPLFELYHFLPTNDKLFFRFRIER